MPPRTLYEFLDRAMVAMHTDAVKLGKELGIDDSWIRNLKNGRIKNDPDADRMKALAAGLKIDEAELWRYLGRMDKVAELRGEPLHGDQEPMPEWARRLEKKIDAVEEMLRTVGLTVEGAADGLATLLAAQNPAHDRRPADMSAEPAPPQPAGHRRQKKRPAGGARPSWEKEPELESRTS